MRGPLLAAALACAGPPAADPLPPPCRPTPAVTARRSVPLTLVLGPGVDEDAVAALVAEQADLAARLGLDLVVDAQVARVGLRAPVGGDAAGLGGLATEGGAVSPADPPGTAEARAAGARLLFAPARSLLAARADAAAPGVIDVVVTAELVAPDSPARAALAGLSALTVSPALLPPADRAGGFDLRQALPARYRPTIFVSWRAWSQVRAAPVDDLLVHELGHALGRAHRDDVDNLMGPRRWSSCVPVLDQEQRAALFGG